MKELSDSELLRTYAELGSEHAFEELVLRHLDIVHSAALRMIRDTHLAEDATQATFAALAKNAPRLAMHPLISGWLHRTVRNIAAQTIRDETRRRSREQEATAMNDSSSETVDAGWNRIEPHLDAALDELSEPDRHALLLRFFERKTAREMGMTLGIGEEAAQKRVTRALDRLRDHFARHGVAVGTGGLAALLTTNAVQASPSSLLATVLTATPLAGISVASAVAKTTVMTTLPKVLATTTLLASLAIGVYEARKVTDLSRQNRILQEQQAPLLERLATLEQERHQSTNRLAALLGENERLKQDAAELLKLRGQIGLLKRDLAAANTQASNKQENQDGPSEKRPWKLREAKKISDLHNVGNKTPEAAAETVLWAAHNAPEQLLQMVHLPPGPLTKLPLGVTMDETLPDGVTLESATLNSLAVWIGMKAIIAAQDDEKQFWIDGGETTTVAITDASNGVTNAYSGVVDFRLSGRRNMRQPSTEGHNDYYFTNIDGVWKLVVPGLSPDILENKE